LEHVIYDSWAIGNDNIKMIFYCPSWRVPLNTADRHQCCNFVTDIMKLLVTGRYDGDYKFVRMVYVYSPLLCLNIHKREVQAVLCV